MCHRPFWERCHAYTIYVIYIYIETHTHRVTLALTNLKGSSAGSRKIDNRGWSFCCVVVGETTVALRNNCGGNMNFLACPEVLGGTKTRLSHLSFPRTWPQQSQSTLRSARSAPGGMMVTGDTSGWVRNLMQGHSHVIIINVMDI